MMTTEPPPSDAVLASGSTRFEASDYPRAQWSVPSLRRRSLRSMLLGVVVTAFALAVVGPRVDGVARALLVSACLAGLGLATWLVGWGMPMLVGRYMAEIQGSVRYELTERALRFQTERLSSEVPWTAAVGWVETPDAFVTEWAGAPFFVFTPKRAFAGADEVARVRATLATHVRTRPAPSRLGCVLVSIVAAAVVIGVVLFTAYYELAVLPSMRAAPGEAPMDAPSP